MNALKIVGKFENDTVYVLGRRVVAHYGSCLEKTPTCSLHTAVATKKSLQRLLDGSARKFNTYDVSYSSKMTVGIGCKKVPLTLIRKALKALS